jgi:hypothetical protein
MISKIYSVKPDLRLWKIEIRGIVYHLYLNEIYVTSISLTRWIFTIVTAYVSTHISQKESLVLEADMT